MTVVHTAESGWAMAGSQQFVTRPEVDRCWAIKDVLADAEHVDCEIFVV